MRCSCPEVYTHANVLCIESFILMYDTARVELLLMPLLLSKPLGSGSNRCALCAASYGSTGPLDAARLSIAEQLEATSYEYSKPF